MIFEDTDTKTLQNDTLAGARGEILSVLDMDLDETKMENRWLVTNLVRRSTVVMLDGMGSTGKSLLATQLAVAIAGGWPFLGYFTVPRAGKVAYINAEDPHEEAWLRIKKIAKNYDQKLIREAAMNIRIFFADDIMRETRSTILLDRNMQPTPFFDIVADFCKRWQPDLLIFDPLGRYVAVENDNAYAAQVYTQLQSIGTTIMMVHHTNKLSMSSKADEDLNDRAKSRGASNWVEMTKTRLYLRDGELRIDKCNYCYENQGKRIKIVFMDDMFHATGKLEKTAESEADVDTDQKQAEPPVSAHRRCGNARFKNKQKEVVEDEDIW